MELRYQLAALRERLPADYLAALLAAGRQDGEILRIEAAQARSIRAAYEPRPIAPPPASKPRERATIPARLPLENRAANRNPIPRDLWPAWAIQIARQAMPSDQSIVDTIERTVGAFGSDAFKLWFAETFGVWTRVCNCAGIRARWRVDYPFANPPLMGA